MTKHNIQSPADMNKTHWNKLLANIPKNLRPNVIEKLDAFAKVSDHEDLKDTFYYLVLWINGFPNVIVYDPKHKAEYWKNATEELCEYLDDRIEKFRQKDHIDKPRSYDPFPLAIATENDEYFFPYRLADAQKTRLLDGEPLYLNPNVGRFFFHDYYQKASWQHPNHPAQAFLFEARDEELAPLKISETPELESMKLTVGDISRWDGSTSLQPVARIVAAHSAAIPWQWRTSGGADASKTVDIVFMDRNGSFLSGPWGLNHRETTPSESPPPNDSAPDAAFLSNFSFNQTHQGYVNLIEGTRDLMFATRMPSKDELALMKQKNVELEYHPFAKDAFVFIGNRNNPVRDLTPEQVRSIFSGKTTQWKEVGGFGGTILPLVRDRNSGSEELMRELVMKDLVVPDNFLHHLFSSMSGIYDFVEKNTMAIGYSILYYERYMVRSPYTRTIRINGIEPTPQTVADGTYPFLYECVAVVRKDSPEKAKAVAQWLTGDEGAKVVRESGYVPLVLDSEPRR